MFPCAILCGGLATRLRPITETIPKSLISIAGEPFIAHQLRLLSQSGIERVVLCAGFLAEMIQDFVGDGSAFNLRVSYSLDGPTLLGTAGSIRKALPVLDSSFFVLYGDSYLPCSYKTVKQVFEHSRKRGLMTFFYNQNLFDASNVEAMNGAIVEYDKRNPTPAMKYIDYGLGIFDRSVFEELPSEATWDLAQVYRDLLAAEDLAGHEVQSRFYEIGSLNGIRDFERYIGSMSRTGVSSSNSSDYKL